MGLVGKTSPRWWHKMFLESRSELFWFRVIGEGAEGFNYKKVVEHGWAVYMMGSFLWLWAVCWSLQWLLYFIENFLSSSVSKAALDWITILVLWNFSCSITFGIFLTISSTCGVWSLYMIKHTFDVSEKYWSFDLHTLDLRRLWYFPGVAIWIYWNICGSRWGENVHCNFRVWPVKFHCLTIFWS